MESLDSSSGGIILHHSLSGHNLASQVAIHLNTKSPRGHGRPRGGRGLPPSPQPSWPVHLRPSGASANGRISSQLCHGIGKPGWAHLGKMHSWLMLAPETHFAVISSLSLPAARYRFSLPCANSLQWGHLGDWRNKHRGRGCAAWEEACSWPRSRMRWGTAGGAARAAASMPARWSSSAGKWIKLTWEVPGQVAGSPRRLIWN